MAEYTDKALKIVQNAVNAKPVGIVNDFNDAMLQRVRDTIAGKKADFINKFANNELDDDQEDDISSEEELELTPEEEAELDIDDDDINDEDIVEDEEELEQEDQPTTDDEESEEKTDG